MNFWIHLSLVNQRSYHSDRNCIDSVFHCGDHGHVVSPVVWPKILWLLVFVVVIVLLFNLAQARVIWKEETSDEKRLRQIGLSVGQSVGHFLDQWLWGLSALLPPLGRWSWVAHKRTQEAVESKPLSCIPPWLLFQVWLQGSCFERLPFVRPESWWSKPFSACSWLWCLYQQQKANKD